VLEEEHEAQDATSTSMAPLSQSSRELGFDEQVEEGPNICVFATGGRMEVRCSGDAWWKGAPGCARGS
jgi:hypothetical protein